MIERKFVVNSKPEDAARKKYIFKFEGGGPLGGDVIEEPQFWAHEFEYFTTKSKFGRFSEIELSDLMLYGNGNVWYDRCTHERHTYSALIREARPDEDGNTTLIFRYQGYEQVVPNGYIPVNNGGNNV